MVTIFAGGLVSPNVGLIFWMTLTFVALLFLLRKFAWGPILSALDERQTKIDDSMTLAERKLEESRQIAANNEQNRMEAEVDAQRILREARDAVETLRAEGKTRVVEELKQLREQASAEIERDKQAAINALRAEVAGLALSAAEKLIHENMDNDRNRKLVDEFMHNLPGSAN